MPKSIYTDKNYFDQRFGNLDTAISGVHEMLGKHEKRISSLEKFKTQIIFGVSLVMTTITLLGDQIKKKLGWV